MTLDPPLPVVFFSLIASLKDKSPKGYPVKKVDASWSYNSLSQSVLAGLVSLEVSVGMLRRP